MWNFYRPDIPGFWKRAQQSARYTIRGITPDTWMSPLQPLPPFDPVIDNRQFDYAVGRNIFYTPRGTERYKFQELRNLARNSELVRLAIETRQDQLDSLKWVIKPVDNEATPQDDPRIKAISRFFETPDKIHDWAQWLRIVIEELLAIDAVCITPRMNRGGGLYSLDLVDGETIFPLIDDTGRQPLPPSPAYSQILKGVPKCNYTSDQLIYAVRKTQVNTPYGWSVVEQIAETAKTEIERLKYTLAYFTEGSVPDAYITAPDNMLPAQVAAYELHFNNLMAGNATGRRQMPVLLHGMEVKSLKQAELKNEFDEWLARKVCFAFSLPPTAFIKQQNRATAESEQERAKDEGLSPLMNWLTRLMNRIIVRHFDSPDLEFAFVNDREQDPLQAMQIDTGYVDNAIKTINEVRAGLGLDDIEGGDKPMVKTPNGYVPLDAFEQQQAQQQANAEARTAALQTAAVNPPAGQAANNAAKLAKKKSGDWNPYRPTDALSGKPHLH